MRSRSSPGQAFELLGVYICQRFWIHTTERLSSRGRGLPAPYYPVAGCDLFGSDTFKREPHVADCLSMESDVRDWNWSVGPKQLAVIARLDQVAAVVAAHPRSEFPIECPDLSYDNFPLPWHTFSLPDADWTRVRERGCSMTHRRMKLRRMSEADVERATHLLEEIADLLDRYGVHRRAEFVRSLSNARSLAWNVVAGLEFWGGSGAIWEIEPFRYSHPSDERSIGDTRRFQQLMIELSTILEARGLGQLSHRNAEVFRRELDGG